jgi:hypothetical protein
MQAGTASAPPSHAKIVEEAQKLVELAKADASQEQLDQQAELVAKLSEAAGTNRVVQELNDGHFRGFTLTVSGGNAGMVSVSELSNRDMTSCNSSRSTSGN